MSDLLEKMKGFKKPEIKKETEIEKPKETKITKPREPKEVKPKINEEKLQKQIDELRQMLQELRLQTLKTEDTDSFKEWIGKNKADIMDALTTHLSAYKKYTYEKTLRQRERMSEIKEWLSKI